MNVNKSLKYLEGVQAVNLFVSAKNCVVTSSIDLWICTQTLTIELIAFLSPILDFVNDTWSTFSNASFDHMYVPNHKYRFQQIKIIKNGWFIVNYFK